jgi:hypothetical protein
MNATSGAGRWATALSKGVAAAALLSSAMVVLVTCNRDDPIAPEGSTINVTSSPQTIVAAGGNPGCATVTATLRGKNGVRLPDQEVLFSASAGSLCKKNKKCDVVVADPNLCSPQGTGTQSDSFGQAKILLLTDQSATVTAQSGAIMGNTTVQVTSAKIASISLDGDTQNISLCTDSVNLIATVVDTNGDPISNVVIQFLQSAPTNTTLLSGNFVQAQPRTDANGEAMSTFTPDPTTCTKNCSPTQGDPNVPFGHVCAIEIRAADITGSTKSGVFRIDESVP